MAISDDEMYRNMQFLVTDDGIIGCYIEGHHDKEQFSMVSTDFMKKELDKEVLEDYKEVKVGYHKVMPRDGRLILHFSTKQMRGSRPVMEMLYL